MDRNSGKLARDKHTSNVVDQVALASASSKKFGWLGTVLIAEHATQQPCGQGRVDPEAGRSRLCIPPLISRGPDRALKGPQQYRKSHGMASRYEAMPLCWSPLEEKIILGELPGACLYTEAHDLDLACGSGRRDDGREARVINEEVLEGEAAAG